MLIKLLRETLFAATGLVLVTMLAATVAQAASAPRDLALGLSSATGRALGSVCFAMDVGDEALPCNPAFTARETPADFRASFFAGHNVSYLNDVSTLLAGEGSQETVRDLFSQSHASDMEANVEGAYRRPTFGIGVSPYRIVYYSFIRNQALPVVTLLAAREQTVRVQLAGYAGDEWSWGVQARAVHRVFISRTFTLTDALAEGGGSSILKPDTQNAFYLEPGLLREWIDHPWRPHLSLAISQLGTVDHKNEAFRASPELHVGGAVRPPLGLGVLELGADATFHSGTEEWSDPLRAGVAYEIGMTRLSASVARSEQAFGFLLKYGHMNGGLTYQSRWIENWLGGDEWVRTAFLHFGVDL